MVSSRARQLTRRCLVPALEAAWPIWNNFFISQYFYHKFIIFITTRRFSKRSLHCSGCFLCLPTIFILISQWQNAFLLCPFWVCGTKTNYRGTNLMSVGAEQLVTCRFWSKTVLRRGRRCRDGRTSRLCAKNLPISSGYSPSIFSKPPSITSGWQFD